MYRSKVSAFPKQDVENGSPKLFRRHGNAEDADPEKEIEQTADNENSELLKAFMKECMVKGKRCRVLRDSAAIMDVVHPSYVSAKDFTGECVWIRQVVQEHSVCLPLARVRIDGLFGAFSTEAAFSARLPPEGRFARCLAGELARQLDYDRPALIDACEAPQPNTDGPTPESVADLDARTVARTDAAEENSSARVQWEAPATLIFSAAVTVEGMVIEETRNRCRVP
ncbi:hypothetical protein HPB52_020156 [Rhipicephalus sanguineus]|uniref:Uncharacterized protein n=1 Tax=Rhipicephalus sanguineus TaxID=34632 RepID=A0A9D4SWN0_RHISA|nr:hypothetical protein HPB52_020156 [Rhipicephalus sanguineus]